MSARLTDADLRKLERLFSRPGGFTQGGFTQGELANLFDMGLPLVDEIRELRTRLSDIAIDADLYSRGCGSYHDYRYLQNLSARARGKETP